MIDTSLTKSGQSWEVGNTVNVGFMRLCVVSVQAVKDGLPDIYTLEGKNGQRYEFIPHNGLHKI